MAYTQFFIQSGGDDKASGSTTGSPIYTSTSGNWDGTSVFTPTDGSTPSGTVSVNDWVSVCTNASSATSFVAQVTAVGAGVNGTITVSTTNRYGTVLSSQTGTATLKDGGAQASFTPLANYGNATVPGSTQYCVKQATYTLSGAITIALNGTTTKPIWIRGYNTTVGDLDNGSASLNYPTISGVANLTTFSGNYLDVSGLAITANRSGNTAIASTGQPIRFKHCRFATTSSNAAAQAFANNIAGTVFIGCDFASPSTSQAILTTTATTVLLGCMFDGAGSGSTQVGITANTAGNLIMDHCTINKCGGHGVTITNSLSGFYIAFCTFNLCGTGAAGDAIHLTGVPGSGGTLIIGDSAFFASGAYDINNASGSTTGNIVAANNLSYNPGTGHLNGFGDYAEFNALADASDPRTSATDLHLVGSSSGAGAGQPGQWENLTAGLTSKPDVGAWQRQAGGSGPLILGG